MANPYSSGPPTAAAELERWAPMRAIFMVNQSFVLHSRSLFVFAGEIVEGPVRPGMSISIDFNESLRMDIPIEGVELLQNDGGELAALTVTLEDPVDADFLQQLDFAGENLVVSDGV